MNLAWLTDIHLDFVTPVEVAALARAIDARGADGVIVTGDIATGPTVIPQLEALAAPLARPVWFVLGNHDFYGASIASVRADARALTARHPHLRWLPAAGVIRLDATTALVGHDGWGDGRLGDLAGSRLFLSDFVYIAELAGLAKSAWASVLGALGDEAAAALAALVDEALTWARHVVVATHVPPFREACWHEGAISDDSGLPFFACAAVGEVLRAAMRARPEARMTVLCGHTHSGGVVDVLPNLRVITGGADYGAPALQDALAL